MALTPEGKVKKHITDMLKAYGKDVYYFMPSANGFGKAGVPDIVVCVYGVFVGIEVKADKRMNPPTALQEKNLNEIVAARGASLVIDANDLDFLNGFLGRVIAGRKDLEKVVGTMYGGRIK
jgi:hypothetical protein